MDSKANEISQTRGRGVKERPDLRRPQHFAMCEQQELNPFGGGDRPSSVKDNTNWTNETKPELDGSTSQLSSLNQNSISTFISKNVSSENSLNSTLSPYAKEFIPRSQPPKSNEQEEFDLLDESYPIQELKNFLFQVTLCPEKFDRQIKFLTNVLNQWLTDEETLHSIVNIIFEESVHEPNFRYNGAKLCNHLSHHLISPSDVPKFRSVLLRRCQEEHQRHKELAKTQDKNGYLRGFALFMAELFSQLEVSQNNVKERILTLGIGLLEILDTLLKLSSSDHLKCACQILKCVGAHLEDQERNIRSRSISLDYIFQSLKNISESGNCKSDIKAMISSVLELRAHDWGRTSLPATSTSVEPVVDSTRLNEPVFYGPDGLPITPEEALFLESQRLSPDYGDDEYDDDLYENDEMDDVIQEAYEEFLRSTGQ
ncbi:polyadenylate-binding protein-interacting protein 1 isoform X2 [Centruroides vittatus]|uniref:polyadenylate-binding protein-interacting protein 1 isoform X2 n=1 Tax=Centruroides vittatus TaxID=120091 RepID=UPI00351066B0